MSATSINIEVCRPAGIPIHTLLIKRWDFWLVLVAIILSLPILVVFGSLFSPDFEIWKHLYETVLFEYIVNSLLLMTGVGALALITGVIPAWLVTMYRFPGSQVLEWALLLPLAMPAYITAYTYTGIFDIAGPVQTGLRNITGWQYRDYWFPDIRSPGGAIFILSSVLYPYVYLLARAAFIEQSICVLEVARTLGCNSIRAFFKIALPLARPSIIAGLSLVLMETLADYGTVQYFGIATFTTGIFRTWFGLGNSAAAAQLSALMMLFVMLLILLEHRSRHRQRYHHTSTRYSTLLQKKLLPGPAITAAIICSIPVVVGFLVPFGFLLQWAWQTYPHVVDTSFFDLVAHSVLLAGISALLALFLALFMASGKRLYPSPPASLSIRFAGMGYAIPGTVIAVGVMLPFAWVDNTVDLWLRSAFGISSGLLLSGTLFVLIFAYLVRFLAVSLNTVEAALARIKPSIDEAGRCAGYHSLTLLRKVHIPMMRGSLLTAVLLVFVDVLKELPATLILRPFNFNTLAVRTFELANEERLADAACSALAIVLAGIIPVILISNTISRSRPGHDHRT